MTSDECKALLPGDLKAIGDGIYEVVSNDGIDWVTVFLIFEKTASFDYDDLAEAQKVVKGT
jgi:hypothetical protein